MTKTSNPCSNAYAEMWGAIEAYADAVEAKKGERGSLLVQLVAREVDQRMIAYVAAHKASETGSATRE